MFTVYLIENRNKKIYIGYTSDLSKRLTSHNQPFGPDWTQGKGPWKLFHSEEYSTKSEALARKKYLKSLKAGQRIKQILAIMPNNPE